MNGTPSPQPRASPSLISGNTNAKLLKVLPGVVGTPRLGLLGLLGILKPHSSRCLHFSQTCGVAFSPTWRPARAWPRGRRGKEGANTCLKRPERSQTKEGVSGGKKGRKLAGTTGLHVARGIRKQWGGLCLPPSFPRPPKPASSPSLLSPD